MAFKSDTGFAHIAFEVDNVRETMQKALGYGGSTVREIVTADDPNHDNKRAVFVYTGNPEGNNLELQSGEDM